MGLVWEADFREAIIQDRGFNFSITFNAGSFSLDFGGNR